MKSTNFTFEYIAPGTRIVYLTATGIKEGLIIAVKPILPFDIRLHEETQFTIDYCIEVSEPLKPLYKEWLNLNNVIYAEDFDALMDVLSSRYYLHRIQPESKQQAIKNTELNPDEDIARRTTYLCSDGKFYTISCEPVICHSDPELSYRHFIVDNTPGIIIADVTLSECEQELFDVRGCEVCRIIEGDKGRFIIQDRFCETSGFIFMSLDAAKQAALMLMEEEEFIVIPAEELMGEIA